MLLQSRTIDNQYIYVNVDKSVEYLKDLRVLKLQSKRIAAGWSER